MQSMIPEDQKNITTHRCCTWRHFTALFKNKSYLMVDRVRQQIKTQLSVCHKMQMKPGGQM